MTDADRAPAGEISRATPRIWSFSGCELDERSLELRVAGQVADLDRKPLEVLMHLLRHAGEVVTKDELAEAVWPGRIITDSNLTKTVAVLRAALGEAGQLAIKTVHGYGYRLVAPVSVQASASELPLARFDFRAGESPPLRPEWKLTERIGAGGHGEVWLARHERTYEARVFKFAEAGGALTALKREVTLNRLLRETLPDRDDYQRLLDWNFDQPPFFVESEYAANGNLATWAEARGGLAGIPLATRLEILAQAAEALAAAHSVGVLHKDLKPANLLVVERDGAPRVRLADFGSGSVVDPGALAAHGITQMGFTQAVPVDGTTTGTPLYLAPEVMAGNPFSVQADLYALGVMLYQMVAGDFRKALAPGWEKEVPDELLREDIAQSAAGDPADRIGDAAVFAQRLRSHPQRLQALAAAREQQRQLESARRSARELRRMRVVAAVLLVVAGAVATAGAFAVRARDEARRSHEATQAVNQFLNKDLLAQANPAEGAVKDLTVRRLLDRAADKVAERFEGFPEAAAQMHATLGQAYFQLDEVALAVTHLERAAAMSEELYGLADLRTLDIRGFLASALSSAGRMREACDMIYATRPLLEQALPPEDTRRLLMRAANTRCLFSFSDIDRAIPELRAVIAEFERRGLIDSEDYATALGNLALAPFDRMDFVAAADLHRKSVQYLERQRGPRHLATARARAIFANALTLTGRLEEAERELARAARDEEAWTGAPPGLGIITLIESILRLEQGRFDEAMRIARDCLDSELGRQKQGTFRLAALYVATEAALMLGRRTEAEQLAQETVELSAHLGVARQFHEVPARAQWADALMQRGRLDEARGVLAGISAAEIAEYPEKNTFLALYRRSQGLLAAREGRLPDARAALQESFETYRLRYGEGHWRTQRAHRELAALPPA